MYPNKFQNVNGNNITVTSTASSLFDLINTAQSTTLARAGFSPKVNGLLINLESGGNVRIEFGGLTPTATKGTLLLNGTSSYFPNIRLADVRVVRVTNNVACSVVLVESDPSESPIINAASSSSNNYQDNKYAKANVAASQTDSSIVAAVTAKKIRVMAVYAVAGATATDLTFNSKPAGAGTAISALLANGSNGGEILPFSPVGWFETVAGEGLTVTTGAGSTTGIGVVYQEV